MTIQDHTRVDTPEETAAFEAYCEKNAKYIEPMDFWPWMEDAYITGMRKTGLERATYLTRILKLEAVLFEISEPVENPIGDAWDFYDDVRRLAGKAVGVPFVENTFIPAAPAVEASEDGFLPLPENGEYGWRSSSLIDRGARKQCYSADQMHAYVLADRAARQSPAAPAEPSDLPPNCIRFDFINSDGQEDSKVITHDEMRQRYADQKASALSVFATPAAPVGSIELPSLPEPLEIDWPELHQQALGCGVEDRNLTNRYECAEYGFNEGVDCAASCVPNDIYDSDQLRAYGQACIDLAMKGQTP